MKKLFTVILYLSVALLLSTQNLFAQTITSATYAYSRSGFAPDLTGTWTELIGFGQDNVASAVTNIGFTFWLAGTPYTQFSVSDNGLLTLGSTQISGTDVVNSLGSATTLPKIAPYWDDLSTGTNGYVRYKVIGTAPNRELVVTWYVTVPKNIAGAANSTIQLRMAEATGLISFTYGTPAVPANANQYSIGIGVSATDFASITPTSATFATCAYGTANDANTISPGIYTRYYLTPDATVPTITYTALANTLLPDNRTFTATIGDAKTGIPTSGTNVPRVYYKKNWVGTYTSAQGILTAGTSTSGTWSFTINHADPAIGGVVPRDTIYYFVVAQDQASWKGTPNIASNPTGVVATDVNTITTPPAAPNKYKILGAPVSGILTVGAAGSGAAFTSLSLAGGAFQEINDGKLTGNVTVQIITDLTGETTTIPLNAWVNDVGGPYTVTINPVGVRTVTGGLKINGANGVTIDGLNDGTNSLTFPGILLAFGASNNTITRITINGAIQFNDASGTFPVNCSNNTINNCTINATGVQAAMYFGSWVSTVGTNNVISNNVIKNFSQYGIHIDRGYTNFVISGNDIFQTVAGNYSTGIYIYNQAGSTSIYNNKIHDITSGTGLGVWTAGIYYRMGVGTDVLDIHNNVITLDATTVNTQAYQLIGLFMSGAGTSNIYYNSIYIGGANITSGNSACIHRTGGTVNFKNNALFNARSGSAPSAYYKNFGIVAFNLTGFTSNNNLIFTNGVNGVIANVGTGNLGQNTGTYYNTLSEWQTGTSQDLSSYSGDPGYTSTTDLTPDPVNPNSAILNQHGTPIATINVDILGNARSTTNPTDIGAYEFTPVTFTISGNAGIAGAILSWNDSGPQTAAADGTGAYSFAVSYNWSGTVTPSLPGYSFTPASITYAGVLANQVNQDYTAASVTITISGNAGIAGTTLSWTDGTAKTTTADGTGAYSFTVIYNWSGAVTPSLTGYVFTPANRSYTNVITDQTAQDYTTNTYVDASIKVFLQGSYNAGSMTTALNTGGLIPLTSETAYPAATFGYTARSVVGIPAGAVDWILVELRTGTAAATKVSVQAAFLKSDGTIVDTNGTSLLRFAAVSSGNYYIVLRHRNHVAIMSATAVPLSSASVLYDFTTAQTQAFGTNAMATLGVGVFGMASGDTDDNSLVSSTDYNPVSLGLFTSGYLSADLNMDGLLYVDDYNAIYQNLFLSTQVP